MQKLNLRLARLIEQPIRVHNEESFDKPEAESVIMSVMPGYDQFIVEREKIQAAKLAHPIELRMFYEEPLLTREQEYHLFKQFNFLKHHANKILQKCDTVDPVASEIEKVESLLSQSAVIKRQLAGSNVRLVMNIAKKQKEYVANSSIDLLTEIVSDGYMGLVHSIDYFDYRLGNKFSTYATWVILDSIKRSRQKRLKHAACTNGVDKFLRGVTDGQIESEYEDVPVNELLKKIPARQRKIIAQYFGLENGRSSTLEEIGGGFGISKERVRQLRDKGLKKLRNMLVK